jgi:hypothetical protein
MGARLRTPTDGSQKVTGSERSVAKWRDRLFCYFSRSRLIEAPAALPNQPLRSAVSTRDIIKAQSRLLI